MRAHDPTGAGWCGPTMPAWPEGPMIMRGELSIVGRRQVRLGHVRLGRAAVLLVAATAPLCWLATATGLAHAAVRDATGSLQTLTIGDAAEAWYAASPVDVCTTPLGCPPPQASTSPYPADTLHVGAAGGQESARTYLLPDFSSLPFGATLVGGDMTLPVASGTGDGTVTPESAKIRACLATKPVTDGAQGSTAAPPGLDCDVSTTPTYRASDGTFTLDLQPFIDAWAGGQPRLGIALVPDAKSAAPTDTWHVAFNGRKRAGAAYISSSVVMRIPPPSDPPTVVPAALDGPAAPAAAAPVPPVPAAVAPMAPAPVVAPAQQQPQPLQAQPVALVRPFQYPLAFLLPLALLAAAVFFARLFTRDAAPLKARA